MPNLFTNYMGRAISGMSMRNKRLFIQARRGGDALMSNSIARYGVMGGGAALAAYGYSNDHPLLGTLGLGLAGGVGMASAYRGDFGSAGVQYASRGIGMMDKYAGIGVDKSRLAYRYGRMKGSRLRRGM
jgi:hypothetical protein